MTKEELREKFNFELEKLSTRAKHILEDQGLLLFEYFFEHYIINENFIDFKFCRNCGVKTRDELFHFVSEICKERDVNAPVFKPVNLRPQLLSKNPIAPLRVDFKLKLLFEAEFQKLSVRTKNILTNIDSNTIDGFYQNGYFKDDQSYLFLRNCGIDTLNEIHLFKIVFKGILDKINNTSIVNNSFSDLEFYIFNSNFFKPIELELFKFYFGFVQCDKSETLTDIANRNNYSRERVRQLSKLLLKRIREALIMLTKFYNLSFQKYFINNHFFVDPDYAEKINNSETTHFTSRFIALVLKYINNPDYILFEVGKTNLPHRVLFLKETVPFDSIKCFRYLNENLFSKKTQSKHIGLDQLIISFSRIEIVSNLEKIESRNIVTKLIDLLNDGENRIIIEEEKIIIRKNARKLLHDIFWEILDEYKKPMHFLDLYQECINRGFEIKSPTSVHSTLIRYNDIFGLKGPGVYGLLEWGGYFGTIGDVTSQILENRERPIPRKELEDILCRELYISKDSISVVLFGYEMENRFVRSPNDTISLKKWENQF